MGGRYDLTDFEWSVIEPLIPRHLLTAISLAETGRWNSRNPARQLFQHGLNLSFAQKDRPLLFHRFRNEIQKRADPSDSA